MTTSLFTRVSIASHGSYQELKIAYASKLFTFYNENTISSSHPTTLLYKKAL